jgi:hypothetical protein
VELLIAVNPDPDSRLPYLIRLPLAGGMVFRTSGTWPRTRALYCYPVAIQEWPADPEIVERVRLRSCVRRGAAIDLVLDRGRENRSQLVFTTARGRDAVFWQSPRTRKQARPNVRTPTARAAGIACLQIVADSHEQYPYRFAAQQATVLRRALPCGDYGVLCGGRLVASVERKSLADLVASLVGGRLRYALAELAALPRAALVVEDRYSAVFKLDRIRPALVADGLAEVQVRWPEVPIVFCETRQLAEEWTYRFLAAAHAWAETEADVPRHVIPIIGGTELDDAPAAPAPAAAEVRAWARGQGIPVPDRGKLRPGIWDAWRAAHRGHDGEPDADSASSVHGSTVLRDAAQRTGPAGDLRSCRSPGESSVRTTPCTSADRVQARGGERRADPVELPGSGRLRVAAGVRQAERGVLGGSERMEREYVDPFDVAERGGEFRHRRDVTGVVGPARDEDETHPDGLVAPGEPTGERERRGYATAGHPPGDGRVVGLDVEQDQVGGVQQRIVGAGAEVAGGVERGVQAEFPGPGQHGPGERGLQQRLTPGNGQPAARGADEPAVPCGQGEQVGGAHPLPVPAVPGVRVVAVHAPQRAARGEYDKPGAGAVDAGGYVPGMHGTGDLGRRRSRLSSREHASWFDDGGHGHADSWKVRLTTSSCCSLVSRTKFTAYPETRIVSCG